MTERFYADTNGAYVGAFDNAEPPAGSVEVPHAPVSAAMLWSGQEWIIPEPTLGETIAAIDAIYTPKFDQLRRDIGTVTLLDGPSMDDKISTLRAKYASTWEEYSAALVAAIPEE